MSAEQKSTLHSWLQTVTILLAIVSATWIVAVRFNDLEKDVKAAGDFKVQMGEINKRNSETFKLLTEYQVIMLEMIRDGQTKPATRKRANELINRIRNSPVSKSQPGNFADHTNRNLTAPSELP